MSNSRSAREGSECLLPEIRYDGEHFIADPIELLNHFEGESRQIREKAWTPFDYQGNLLLKLIASPLLCFFIHASMELEFVIQSPTRKALFPGT